MAVKLQLVLTDGQCITLTKDLIHEDPNQSMGRFVMRLWEAHKEQERASIDELHQAIDKMLTEIMEAVNDNSQL
jgi:hypothetical protein